VIRLGHINQSGRRAEIDIELTRRGENEVEEEKKIDYCHDLSTFKQLSEGFSHAHPRLLSFAVHHGNCSAAFLIYCIPLQAADLLLQRSSLDAIFLLFREPRVVREN
jgi:hypothetical protein